MGRRKEDGKEAILLSLTWLWKTDKCVEGANNISFIACAKIFVRPEGSCCQFAHPEIDVGKQWRSGKKGHLLVWWRNILPAEMCTCWLPLLLYWHSNLSQEDAVSSRMLAQKVSSTQKVKSLFCSWSFTVLLHLLFIIFIVFYPVRTFISSVI